MKILIVKTSAIGDVIHTLPALNCLRKTYPDACIDWLVEEAASEAIIGHRAVDRVIISPRKRWIGLWRKGSWRTVWREFWCFVKDLRSTKYDLLIDFQGLLKSGIFVFLALAERKVGFDKGMDHAEGSWLLLNERIPPVNMDLHAVQRELMLLEGLGIKCEELFFDFPLRDEHRQEVKALLQHKGVDPEMSFVVINPMTTWETKHWYPARFAEVADCLSGLGHTIVFTGGPDDISGVEGIIVAMKRTAINLAGQTGLKTLAALYQLASLVITVDTGPMHIGAAVGTPVVALFGPSAPWRTGPFGQNHTVLRAEIPCSPCLKKNCQQDHDCMTLIGVDQVVAAAKSLLAK